MGSSSSTVKLTLGVDSGQVKTGLAKVKADFAEATAGINGALKSITGLADLEGQVKATGKAYAEVKQKVVELGQSINSSAAIEGLAQDLEHAKVAAQELKTALAEQRQQQQLLKSNVQELATAYSDARKKELELAKGFKAGTVIAQDLERAKVAARELKTALTEQRQQQQLLKSNVQELATAYSDARKKAAELAKEVAGGTALAKDFERAKKAADLLHDQLAKQQQQLQQVRNSMLAAGVSTKGLAGQQAALRSQLEATRQKYQDFAKVAQARSTLNLTPHADIAAGITKAKEAYATLAASGKLSMAELAQAKVALRSKIDELKQGTNGWRDALAGVKAGMLEVAAAGAPTALAIGQAIKFESSMANVQKVVETTPEGFTALREQLLGLTREIPLTANELASIATAGGQLGIASQDLGDFVTVTAKMATAFDMTAEEAGNAIGKIVNVYQLGIGEVNGFGDTINQLGNTTAAREKDIVEVMLRIGGTSRQFGLAKESAAALASAMLSLGKSPETASTAINALLNNMQTAEMGSNTFQEALGKIGLSAKDMAEQVAKDPQKALNDLLATLAQLSGTKRAEVLTGLFGKEFQDDIGVLVGSLGTYQKALATVSDTTAYAGSMNKEFATRAETIANQLQLLKNAVTEAGINLGTTFLPAVRAIISPFTTVLRLFADAAAAFPRLTAALVTVGPGALVFGQVAKLAGVAKLAIITMAGESGTALTALRTTTGSLKTVFASLGPIVTAAAVGYQLGTWLIQFDIVKTAGIALAEVLTLAFLKIKQAWAWVSGGNVEAVQKEIDEAKRIYDDLYLEVGAKAKQAGDTQVKEQAKVKAAVQESATAQKQMASEALQAMQKQYADYAEQVRTAQESLANRTQSISERIREMNREEMSAKGAWLDRKKEAGEYYATALLALEQGKAALAAGDQALASLKFKEAEAAGDKAATAYERLKGVVQDGETVIKTSAQTLKISTDGMKAAADVANDATKLEMETAAKAMDGLVAKAGFADLSKGMDDVQQTWLNNWKNMQGQSEASIQAVDEKIVQLVTPERTVWVNVKERMVASDDTGGTADAGSGYARGGIIQALANGGGVRNILGGGHLPGWGGGDTVPLMGEPGEVMIRKDAVRAAGLRTALAFNSGRFDVVMAELSKRLKHRIGYQLGGLVGSLSSLPVQHLASGGAVNQPAAPAKVVEVRFAGGQVQGDERSVEMLLQHLETSGLSA